MKKLFATPKKAVVSVICVIAALAVLGTGTAVAVEYGFVGRKAAAQAALADAGVAAADAGRIETELEYERGQFLYEVEFKAAGTEYDYVIDAKTGEVLGKTTEGGAAQTQPTADPAVPSEQAAAAETDTGAQAALPEEAEASQPVSQESAGAIGVEEAKAIAAAHAGFDVEEVTFSKVKLEKDDGRAEYEVEFYKDGIEYEYDISAETGDILEYEREREDRRHS